MQCPICNGKGAIGKIVNDKKVFQMCLTCKGTGQISEEKHKAMLNWLEVIETIDKESIKK